MQLTNHRVLITGGSEGIGLALARAFVRRGNRVLVAARRADRLAAAAAQLPGLATAQCDLTDDRQLRALVATTEETLGGLSILVNNAGVQYNDRYIEDDDAVILAHVDAEIGLNLTALVKLTTLCLPLLRRAGAGAIVNVSSVLALAPKRSAPVYCATKAAVRSFTQALRYQLAEATSICVVEALPPMVDTAMTAGRKGNKMSPEEVAREILDGLAEDREEIYVGVARKFAVLRRLLPGVAARTMRNR
jgi:short-subunit dehydrogenase involved in D-alanine esterification of teichoic acids